MSRIVVSDETVMTSPTASVGKSGANAQSHRLNVGRPDNLAPLLGLFGDQFSELVGRRRHRNCAYVG